jgi:hypothetical protein
MSSLAVFAYGSLVSAESASFTLGRRVESVRPAELSGWRRGFTVMRDNLVHEKTFELVDGTCPRWILGLNLERGEAPAGPVNGALVELESEAELARLAGRELRYDAVEVTEAVRTPTQPLPERVFAFTAKPRHHAPDPPGEAVIIAAYARAVESAFASLGAGQLTRFRETTGPWPRDLVEARLVMDAIPEGNPREW